MKEQIGFRLYFDKDLDFLIQEEKPKHHPFHVKRAAMKRLRMYANLYLRDIRKDIINQDSICVSCGSKDKLHLDHIIPIAKGGKNKLENIQILCGKCNITKGDR